MVENNTKWSDFELHHPSDEEYEELVNFYRFCGILAKHNSATCQEQHFIVEHPGRSGRRWRCITCDRTQSSPQRFDCFTILPWLTKEQMAQFHSSKPLDVILKNVMAGFFEGTRKEG